MFEYHGWVTVWEGACEIEDDLALREKNCREIQLLVEKYRDNMSRVELFYQNGSSYVRFDGDRNHYQAWVLELFIRIGEIAKGSHGLLYVRDQESPDYGNEFQVWRMARGKVIRVKDNLLSPCDPTIETYEE
ncbi:Imm7 family immunity protein [Hahella aquimaris]|uniref:Imm7 family immunity protein n=1 Tax=Hahella sp. HNIBRBA332 TaxID=3015983 RepID=UPI00273C9FE7|nr:Imm7 family immunity protein [Hahella sp. HNIBRBA332]WLQ15788.1 Imm7 family immunity protein [Hahella sp. HNIBRBA332]